jgi:protein-S-isoprenylcysteine O-methyltransferase Ste14
MTAFDHIVYGLLWLSFGTIHSLLAGNSMKDRLHPLFGRGYRLAYNLFASLHILLVVVGSRYVFAQNVSGFEWPPMMHLFLTMAMWLGIVIMLIALCQYDLGRFSGLTQLTASPGVGGDDEVEPLHLSGLHRYVRHPLYTGAYLFLWGGVRNEFDFATAIWGSLYLAIGTHFEEQRHLARYGADYEVFCKRVPALVPWRRRVQ